MLNQFLWIILPYICIMIFFLGHVARFKYDKFSWTAKSSEFIEKKQLKWGSIFFHLGIIPVAMGHFIGLIIPARWIEAIGINEHLYHVGAVYIGSIFGIMTLIGMILLTARRITIKNIRRLSSTLDIVVNALILLIVFMGCYATLVTNILSPAFDYRETISVWFRGLFVFSPNAQLMEEVPFAFKIHVLLGFVVLALWPFTRLVHVWSVPLTYANRSYIIYRKHKV